MAYCHSCAKEEVGGIIYAKNEKQKSFDEKNQTHRHRQSRQTSRLCFTFSPTQNHKTKETLNEVRSLTQDRLQEN